MLCCTGYAAAMPAYGAAYGQPQAAYGAQPGYGAAYGMQAFGGFGAAAYGAPAQATYGAQAAYPQAAYGQQGQYGAAAGAYGQAAADPYASAAGAYGAPQQAPAAASPWQELRDDQGRTYYYNSTTGVSQWERPAGMA